MDLDLSTALMETEDGGFYFESDHLALKGNKDYMNLLRTMVILQAQQAQALADLDELHCQRAQCIKDPISFVTKLQNGEINLPGSQEIAELPEIDWSKYQSSAVGIRQGPQTRNGHITPKVVNKSSTDNNNKVMVRGREFDDSKPETFNQLWTVEEQRRLLELLEKYNSEDTETQRCKKIAKELGNRTLRQVASRVQKYKLKLIKQGLTVTGRMPKSTSGVKRSVSGRNRKPQKNSTFFLHFVEENKETSNNYESAAPMESEQARPEDYMKLQLVNIMKQTKLEKKYNRLYPHCGYNCFACKDEPLRGNRWHCLECRDINLCGDCAIGQHDLENPVHNPAHPLEQIKPPFSSDLYYLPTTSDNSYN